MPLANQQDNLLSLTKDELDKRKVASELLKLDIEISKLSRERDLISKHPLLLPSAYIPLLVALIALAGIFIKWRLDLGTSATKATETSSQVAGLEAALAKAPIPPVATVQIRFRGDVKRELMTALQQSLNGNGFVAPPPLRTSEIKTTSLTYSQSSDKDDAGKVAAKAIEIFRAAGCAIAPTPALTSSALAKSRTIELDIYTNCP